MKEEDEKEFYRKTLHSRLLCNDRWCDICLPMKQTCGYVEVPYFTDSAGNRKEWRCSCESSGCKKLLTHIIITSKPLGDITL